MTFNMAKNVLTQTLRLEQVRLIHSNMTTPGKKVCSVVASEKRSRGGVLLELNFLGGKLVMKERQKRFKQRNKRVDMFTVSQVSLTCVFSESCGILFCRIPTRRQSLTPLSSSAMKRSTLTSSPKHADK